MDSVVTIKLKVNKQLPQLFFSPINRLLLSICLLVSNHALADTPVQLRHSFVGNISFELAAGSFLNNPNNLCSISNSSSGELSGNIPDNAKIKAAYLYWAASYNSDQTTPDTSVSLNGMPVTDFSPYTATWNGGFFGTTSHDFYSGVADVTSIVGASGAQAKQNYTITDLNIHTGSPHCNDSRWFPYYVVLGGWSLVVIYEDDSLPFQVANIFDGFQLFQNNQVNLNLSNFQVSGTPSGKHAHITWEGDNSYGGESLKFNGNDLTDSCNPSGEQFNSNSNVLPCSAGSSNTLSVDVDAYDVAQYLTPGDLTATTTYSSGNDVVLLSAEIISVSNIPVADLAVTANPVSGWLSGSQVKKQFTITNKGPNDIPTSSVIFKTTLPSQLTPNGLTSALPENNNWTCLQGTSDGLATDQDIECLYTPALRSGWSNYLTLPLSLNGGITDFDFDVFVNHDNAKLNGLPYDIFDNQMNNNTYNLNVPIVTTAIRDLSASYKQPTDIIGDNLLPGDTLQYTITIDDASDLEVGNISVTDHLPANITSYTVIQLPDNAVNLNADKSITGDNGTGYLNISNISLSAGGTAQIILEVEINPLAPYSASMQNTATISQAGDNWTVDTGLITLTSPDFSASSLQVIDVNSGTVEAGDTLQVTLVIDDLNDLNINSLSATFTLPDTLDNIQNLNFNSSFSNLSSASKVAISDIQFNSNSSTTITFDVDIKPGTSAGSEIPFYVKLQLNDSHWTVAGPTLTVSTALSNITLNKKVEVLSDPVNLTDKPKAIPGAIILHTITIANQGGVSPDNGSIVIDTVIPPNTELFIGDLDCPTPAASLGPLCFTDGSTPNESGLTYTFSDLNTAPDALDFSTDGSNFNYYPDVSSGLYDPSVRIIRITPSGIFNKTDSGSNDHPEFRFKYQTRLQ